MRLIRLFLVFIGLFLAFIPLLHKLWIDVMTLNFWLIYRAFSFWKSDAHIGMANDYVYMVLQLAKKSQSQTISIDLRKKLPYNIEQLKYSEVAQR